MNYSLLLRFPTCCLHISRFCVFFPFSTDSIMTFSFPHVQDLISASTVNMPLLRAQTPFHMLLAYWIDFWRRCQNVWCQLNWNKTRCSEKWFLHKLVLLVLLIPVDSHCLWNWTGVGWGPCPLEVVFPRHSQKGFHQGKKGKVGCQTVPISQKDVSSPIIWVLWLRLHFPIEASGLNS